ncbi:MAG: HAD family hydrolase [Chloroflexi bacterium]|nr:HAD family hydrolase [Chloroflexota bacterium]
MPAVLLFDMDGTLIEDSMDTFLPPYFAALTNKLAGLVPPEKLVAQLTASTQVMMANDNPSRTNAQAFAQDFIPKLGVDRERLMPLIEDFYVREYGELRAYVKPIPDSVRVVSRAFELQRTVVVATAPLFPRTALLQRLDWGGLAGFPFALVTDYETMHASKPNPAYYREIAALVGRSPQDCVMIGNEAKMDIVPAHRAGMKTFWVTTSRDPDVPADWRGTLADFDRLLESGAL